MMYFRAFILLGLLAVRFVCVFCVVGSVLIYKEYGIALLFCLLYGLLGFVFWSVEGSKTNYVS